VEGEQERVRNVGQAALAAGKTFIEVEVRVRWPDESIHWLAIAMEAVLDPQGRPIKAFGIVGDITARKQQEEQRALLVSELNHRVKNVLATVQAIAQQTFGSSADQAGPHRIFKSRLNTLSQAHSLLASENWQAAGLADIVMAALLPFQRDRNIQVTFAGGADTLQLPAQSAVSIAMLLHELCTNAAKYGALSVDLGVVHVAWSLDIEQQGRRLRMRWVEQGGPRVEPPRRRGFGSRIMAGGLSGSAQAKVTLDFDPSGVICTLDAPIPAVG
jgi:two-component sensor histidine kinase